MSIWYYENSGIYTPEIMLGFACAFCHPPLASDIVSAKGRSHDLFTDPGEGDRQVQRFEVMEAVNRRFGSGAVRLFAALPQSRRGRGQRLHYPVIEAD